MRLLSDVVFNPMLHFLLLLAAVFTIAFKVKDVEIPTLASGATVSRCSTPIPGEINGDQK